MPRISEFYGIVIAMFYMDHEPPHFHVIFGAASRTVNDMGGVPAGHGAGTLRSSSCTMRSVVP